MRFLADENIAPSVIRLLRDDGHDVDSVHETSPGILDVAVIQRAKAEDRIILTHDRDFGNVIRYPTALHAGVILIRCRDQSPHLVIRMLQALFKAVPPAKFRQAVTVVTERGIRFYPS